MTREQLNEQHAFIIRRWTRTITDMSGRVPPALLDELAAVAERHAELAVKEAAAMGLTVTPLPPAGPVAAGDPAVGSEPPPGDAASRPPRKTRQTTSPAGD